MDSGTSPIKFRSIMSKALFIGSNPSHTSATATAFCKSTKSGTILSNWCTAIQIGKVAYENVSIFPTPDNRPLNTKEFKEALIALNCRLICYQEAGDWKIIALGKTATKALTLLGTPFYEMPHPSPLNRKLNDPEYVEKKLKGLAEYLQLTLQ